MVAADFDTWTEVACCDCNTLVVRYGDLVAAHLAQKKKNAESRFRGTAERPRAVRSGDSVAP